MQKKLYILLIISGILIVLTWIKTSHNQPNYNIQEEMQAILLFPQQLSTTDINKIELYLGKKIEKKIILQKEQNFWNISNLSAPANKEKIENFFDHLTKLYGELRISGKEFFKDFQLEDDSAIHIKIYQNNQDPSLHFLIGKKEQNKACFIRLASDEHIYRVGSDWRQNIGISSDDIEKSPEYQYWLQKQILSLNKDKIKALELTYPDKKIKAEIKETKINNEESKQEEIKKEWKIVSSTMSKEILNQYEWNSLVENLASLEVDDVADNQTKENLKNIQTSYSAEIILQDESKQTLRAIRNLNEPEGDIYCFLQSNPALVYKIAKWKFNGLFKKGSSLFTLPFYYRPEKSQIKGLEMATPDGSVLMHRIELDNSLNENKSNKKESEKTSWVLVSPKENVSIQREHAETILTQLQTTRFADYTDETGLENVGLQQPSYTLTILMKDDSTHTIKIGNISKNIDGYYAMIDDQRPICAFEKYDFEKLFPEFNKLLNLTLIQDEIIEFVCEKEKERVSLLKENGVWLWKMDQANDDVDIHKNGEADSNKVKNLFDVFKSFTAKKISFNIDLGKMPKAIANIRLQGKESYDILIYPKDNIGYMIRSDSHQACFWIEESIGNALLQNAEYYQK